MSTKTTPLALPVLAGLLILKAALHFTAILADYGLHRDEFLYLAEGDHPGWGYMEGPPMIGWIATLSTGIFGNSIWAAKLPVLLIGLLSIWLLLRLTAELGGGAKAQLIAGTAWVLSPMYLGSNHLFQPVSFNQFCWLWVAFSWIRVIKYERPKDWYLLGLAAGIGLLTKYSIVFYLLALITGILLTAQRRLLARREAWIAAGIALALWLPNLAWQWYYDFPVIGHMEELARTQLVNFSALDFMVPQFLFHFAGSIVWVPGLLVLLGLIGSRPGYQGDGRSLSMALAPYRSLGWALLFTWGLLLLLSGKPYYSMGAYPPLLAVGGLFWVATLPRLYPVILAAFLLNFPLIPYGLPMLPVDQMREYGTYMRDHWGLSAPLRWEDGSTRDLRQDYADMHGWEEMVARTAEFYHELPPEERAETMLYGGNYGQAGALNFYRKKYDLPRAHSFNASYILWVEEEVDFERMLIVDDVRLGPSEWFGESVLIDSLRAPNARQLHYLYYRSEPTADVREVWREEVRTLRRERLGRE